MSGNIRKMDNNNSFCQNSSKMRIKAFPTTLSDHSVTKIWDILKKAIIEIQRKNNSGLSFEELYRNAYTMVLQKNGEQLYNGTKAVITEHMCRIRDDVYNKLTNNFLTVLNRSWKDHITAMIMIRDILMYLDRVYVNNTEKASVYNLGMIVFRDTVLRYDPIRCQLRMTLLDMVRRERHGEVISRTQLRDACQMLVQLGVDKSSIYEEDFEAYFLEQTTEYYALESVRLLNENPSNVYIIHVNKIIEDESKRALDLLHPTTETKIIHVLNEELIRKHIDKIVNNENSGLIRMLSNKKYLEIGLMYNLLQRVSGGLETMSACISKFLRDEGKKIVEDDKSPQIYIQELISLREKASELLQIALATNQLFKNQINADFEYFINQNKRSPEYLSLYIDDKLKRGTKGISDQDIDTLFDKCIILFRYLQDKDVFERYYKQHLAKRLLMSKSQSDDQEKSMISKLLIECGGVFTSKLEGMFKDMAISKTLMEEFHSQVMAYNPNSISFDLFVRVLTTGLWPTQSVNQDVILPEEANLAFRVYSQFYLGKHTGRVINLQHNLGSVELIAFYGGHYSTFANNKCVSNGPQVTSSTDCNITSSSSSSNTSAAANNSDSMGFYHSSNHSSQISTSNVVNSTTILSNNNTNASSSSPYPINSLSSNITSPIITYTTPPPPPSSSQTLVSVACSNLGSSHSSSYRKYILQVSTYQMIVLMKFNNKSRYTFGELLDETKIPEIDLTRCLIALSLSKPSQRLLIKEPKNKSMEFTTTDSFTINEAFLSKHIKIKIQSVAVKETEPEVRETNNRVDENRKYVIEATIVRVMKARKSLQHNILIAEVIDQLKSRFVPTPQMIKHRIESLLERDYLARSEADRRIYLYQA